MVQGYAWPGPFSALSLQDGPSCTHILPTGSPCWVWALPWVLVPLPAMGHELGTSDLGLSGVLVPLPTTGHG